MGRKGILDRRTAALRPGSDSLKRRRLSARHQGWMSSRIPTGWTVFRNTVRPEHVLAVRSARGSHGLRTASAVARARQSHVRAYAAPARPSGEVRPGATVHLRGGSELLPTVVWNARCWGSPRRRRLSRLPSEEGAACAVGRVGHQGRPGCWWVL